MQKCMLAARVNFFLLIYAKARTLCAFFHIQHPLHHFINYHIIQLPSFVEHAIKFMLRTFIKSRAATFAIAAAFELERSFFMLIEMFAIHQLDLHSSAKLVRSLNAHKTFRNFYSSK